MIILTVLVSLWVFGRCLWITAKQSVYPRLPSSTHISLFAMMGTAFSALIHCELSKFYGFHPQSDFLVFVIMAFICSGVEIWASGIRKRGRETKSEEEVLGDSTRFYNEKIHALEKQILDLNQASSSVEPKAQ